MTTPLTRDASHPLERFDLYDPDLADQVYDVLADARKRCPVPHSTANGGFWLVTRYEDVKAVLHDDATYISSPGKSLPVRQTHPMPPIDSDPPMHREFRLLLNRFFSRTALEPYATAIRDIARETVDSWLGAGRCELVGDFANPFTATVLAKIILDLDDVEAVREVQRLVEAVGSANAATAWQDLEVFVKGLLESRRNATEQPDDVIGTILNGTVAGRPLTEAERMGVTTVLLLGGLDTTKGAISNIVWRMTEDPALEDRLRTSDWTRTSLDEFLRIDSPVTALARTVTTDTILGDAELHPGDHVLVHYASANRDDAVFEHPDQLDLDRGKNPHVAFGLGIHRCIGSNLARISIGAAINEILERVEQIRLAPGVEVHFTPGAARHPTSLPIEFRPRG